ncbi:hypothetical protein JAAARDRAFT_651208 [Jaapia argillacea MUCL 33604]|uniref:Uncharacterized protein n=1 Tax=Jaapia argillacea MUCL 33604 TaxID=933084 RepID=A0A067PW53_9AGAM|nr:hypothetical protein JAAARDRAFT_651208 [Jaapia argillacea MUCL 33604]
MSRKVEWLVTWKHRMSSSSHPLTSTIEDGSRFSGAFWSSQFQAEDALPYARVCNIACTAPNHTGDGAYISTNLAQGRPSIFDTHDAVAAVYKAVFGDLPSSFCSLPPPTTTSLHHSMDANGATFSGSPLTPEALQRLAQSLVPVLARELSSGSNAPMRDGREHGRYDGDAPPAPRNTSYVPFYSPRPNAPSVSLPFMIPVLGDTPQEAPRNTANGSTGVSTVHSSAPISSIPPSSPPSSADSSDLRRSWEYPLSDDLS